MKLFIHRKDLRTVDLAAFDYLKEARQPTLHLLILDPFLLQKGREKEHSGVNFLRHVSRLRRLYDAEGRTLHLVYGEPSEVLDWLLAKLKGGEHEIDEVVAHRDFTPYARERDRKLKQTAEANGAAFTLLVDSLMIDPERFAEFTGKDGYYKIFAPFHRKWLEYLAHAPNEPSSVALSDLEESGAQPKWLKKFALPFDPDDYEPADEWKEKLDPFLKEDLAEYGDKRDYYPELPASGVNPHVNAGAVSIRELYARAIRQDGHDEWVRQLAFRDFYLYLAVYDPDYFSYEKKYDLSALTDEHFERWAKGQTGIPAIDAAMTELNETGLMPNRLRILCAMFLTKNLRCPFTLGEQYFRRKLLDYDNIQNRGNWLWCASLGANSAPYFRVVNPVTQSEKYDPNGEHIRQWLPELKDEDVKTVHKPRENAVVDLKVSRADAIETYKSIVNGGKGDAK
ncbi:deoxyribodipyrimidine photo-lyase [Saccharibacillus sp. CPCC 101409]|uniref:cryptochrome/photolyase family protein n=1 Tax=Saccharibacillus sp. CPCC 101409 TaxID=3058041 RepID=UPI002673E5B8|nr:deoxyribodipyrimidine photo-lyase [Saccharibacillus sp. CPCC 101409]MDO3408423.1 deoxyribodipyrimidine photo-lyase [Saccharibacillus sp. CPCC 101409]